MIRRRPSRLQNKSNQNNESLANQIAKSARRQVKKTHVEFLSSGSVVLNLAASQKGEDGGWARGRIINIVGDGSSGKTMLALEACFNAFKNIRGRKSTIYPPVKSVKIIYNNVEGVMDFPLEEMYGQNFVNTVDWRQSPTCEAFGVDYQREVSKLGEGDFLLYVIDSIDATISEKQQERIDKKVKGQKLEKGTYGTEKAKFFSNEFFNDLTQRMHGKDATLICISQVRENLNAGQFGKKFYRTGGKALDFYTHQVCWLYTAKKMTKAFRSQERAYGVRVKANFERNKVAKPFRTAEFVIFFDYGLDDIWSMLDYLFVKEPTKKIPWEGQEYARLDLIRQIEDDPEQYKQLVKMTEKDWLEIEEEIAIAPKRKRRF